MSDTFADKRKFPRINSENAVLVKKVSTQPAEGFVKTRVVGLGGCMFVTDESLGVGSDVELLIAVSGRVVKASGRIVYEIPKGPRSIEVGIEFLDLAESDRDVIDRLFNPDEGSTSPDPAPAPA